METATEIKKVVKFKLDLNLDDVQERNNFLDKYSGISPEEIAQALGFVGDGAVEAAKALLNYAWNAEAAKSSRLRGDGQSALHFDRCCNQVYSEEILDVIECW